MAQQLLLELPLAVMERAQQVADALHTPVETVISNALTAALPHLEDVPVELRPQLARMTSYTDAQLWELTAALLTADQQERLGALGQIASERALTDEEQAELEALRDKYGRLTLLKARAYALLSLRGGKPLLSHAA